MDGAAKRDLGKALKQLVSFTVVGLIGLGVDAGVFVLLTSAFLWSIAFARTVSVCCTIFTTWTLNRAVTFAAHRSPRRGEEFVRYVAVQLSGLVVNIGVFASCLWLVPVLRPVPVVALVLGGAAGFAFNFTVMRTVVFRGVTAR